MSRPRHIRLAVAVGGVAIVGLAAWALYTRRGRDAGPLPTGESLLALRKRFQRELSYCGALPARDRSPCLENRALETREVFFCAEIADLAARDRCLLAFVPAVGVYRPCEAVTDAVQRTGCLATAATMLGDVGACKALVADRPRAVASCQDDGHSCARKAAWIDTIVQLCPVLVRGDPASCPKDDVFCRTAMAARRRDPSLVSATKAAGATSP